VELKTAVFLLKQKLISLEDRGDVAIAFPDDGAHKRFSSKFPEYPLIVMEKVRTR
jgi:hypothetical protein